MFLSIKTTLMSFGVPTTTWTFPAMTEEKNKSPSATALAYRLFQFNVETDNLSRTSGQASQPVLKAAPTLFERR